MSTSEDETRVASLGRLDRTNRSLPAPATARRRRVRRRSFSPSSSSVRRQVALKIIKLGMDTRDVVARFEQERWPIMDHPHIAKVIDAGATDQGRPAS
jgi:hypothetical protein